jgi:hypothetical protein
MGTGGLCCEATQCKRYDFCSFEAAEDNLSLKMWSCPHDMTICGPDTVLVANRFGYKMTKKPRTNALLDLNKNNMCRYRVVFPVQAG